MSFFHHDEQPRVVINQQPPTEAKQGPSATEAIYDAVAPGLAQNRTAAESNASPSVDGSIQTLNAEGNVAVSGADTQSSSSEASSIHEAPQSFDPSPQVDTTDPVVPDRTVTPPNTEFDAFGVPKFKTNAEQGIASTQGTDTLVSEKPVIEQPAVIADVSYKPELQDAPAVPTLPQSDSVISENHIQNPEIPVSQPEDQMISEAPKFPEVLPETSVEIPVETQKWVESIDSELESLHADIVKYQQRLDEFKAKVEDLMKTKAAFTNPEVARAVQYMEKNKTEKKNSTSSNEETGHGSEQEDVVVSHV